MNGFARVKFTDNMIQLSMNGCLQPSEFFYDFLFLHTIYPFFLFHLFLKKRNKMFNRYLCQNGFIWKRKVWHLKKRFFILCPLLSNLQYFIDVKHRRIRNSNTNRSVFEKENIKISGYRLRMSMIFDI